MKVVYIVREGLERGLGRYMGPGAGADWRAGRVEAMQFADAGEAFLAAAAACAACSTWRVVKVKISPRVRVFGREDVEKLAAHLFNSVGGYGLGTIMGGWWLAKAAEALEVVGKVIP